MNPNPIKPAVKALVKPKVSKKLPAYKEFIPANWQQHSTGNCHYVFLDENNRTHTHLGDVCFARFTNYNGIVKGKMLINQHEKPSTYSHNDKWINKPEFRTQLATYLKWVVRESPFRWAFTNGKSDFFQTGLNFNCNAPHHYVFGACLALREGWEFPWRVEYWHKMVDAGVSKTLSYYVISMLGQENGLIGGQGHAVMGVAPSGQAYDWFRTLSKAKVLKLARPMKENAYMSYQVSQLFTGSAATGPEYKKLFGTLQDWLKTYAEKEQKAYGTPKLQWTPELFTALKGIDNA